MHDTRKARAAGSGAGCRCWWRWRSPHRRRPRPSRGYPNRPVHILVPYGPGGVADTTMRLLAQKLNERLGQPFVIENRPGAGGIVPPRPAPPRAPDGYSLA